MDVSFLPTTFARTSRTLRVAVLKPTLTCNADCSYCCAPPEAEASPSWDVERLRAVAGYLAAHAAPSSPLQIIWHGGEPMLAGTAFYRCAHALFTEAFSATGPNAGFTFSMQTNLLRYGPAWRDLFLDPAIFQRRISTSYEPGGTRTVSGDPALYTRLFSRRFEQSLEDGLPGFVVATCTSAEQGRASAEFLYDWSIRRVRETGSGFAFRLNYVTPTGRHADSAQRISPVEYGALLVDLAERWLADGRPFEIVPLSQMAFAKASSARSTQCPWTASCGRTFLCVEPSGECWNCPDFADLGDPQFLFGNLFDHVLRGAPDPLDSPAARAHARRPHQLPASCRACPHLSACQGGCHRDAILYDRSRGLAGKFAYCASWTAVFNWIDAHPDAFRSPPARVAA